VAIAISFLIGLSMIYFVKGKAVNFFVAGRTLPLYVVVFALTSSSIDSNALLGNANLSFKYQFWDGAALPIGLGASLILNGIFFAHKINKENVLTLPDVYAQKYGRIIEIMTSIVTIISFTMLLAGNLVGLGSILSYVWNISLEASIYTAAAIMWVYTISGGLFSVAYTDVFQGCIGWYVH
jgi:Na+/proline symporter